MDSTHTYAEIPSMTYNVYENIDDMWIRSRSSTSDYSSGSSSTSSSRRPSPDYLNNDPSAECQLPIDYRYRKRGQVRSDNGYSSSSSSGYSMATSTSSSSIQTVINGGHSSKAKKNIIGNNIPIDLPSIPNQTEIHKKDVKTSRPCCIECREKELEEEYRMSNHVYENLKLKSKNELTVSEIAQPYVLLLLSVFRSLRNIDHGKKVEKVQRKVEKVLRISHRETFSITDQHLFDKQLNCFARKMEIRLRAINDVSPTTFHDISAKLCDALHSSSNSNNNAIKSLFKAVKNFLS